MIEKQRYFTIKEHNDIYKCVGKIIEAAQEWEADFKSLAKLLKIELPNDVIDKSSLNRLNNELKKFDKISDKDFENLSKVIDKRNYINHQLFLAKKSYQEIEDILNDTIFYIYEANDVISNKIDSLNGSSIIRPTVFD